jgi:hypothetical protein
MQTREIKDILGQQVLLAHKVLPAPEQQEVQEQPVLLARKVKQDQLEPEQQEVQVLRGPQDHKVLRVIRDGPVLKEQLALQGLQVLLV